jgi:hypothetical protein
MWIIIIIIMLSQNQKIPEQHTGEARNHRTAESSHTGHSTHTAESANVEVKIFNMGHSSTRAG